MQTQNSVSKTWLVYINSNQLYSRHSNKFSSPGLTKYKVSLVPSFLATAQQDITILYYNITRQIAKDSCLSWSSAFTTPSLVYIYHSTWGGTDSIYKYNVHFIHHHPHCHVSYYYMRQGEAAQQLPTYSVIIVKDYLTPTTQPSLTQ